MWKSLRNLHHWCNRHEWMIVLVLLVLVLRLPSLVMPHYYGDEEIYFVMGRAWSEGVPLYQAMFDHKPPLIYILAGIAPTMFAFRGLLAISMVIHTILFYKLAELMFGKTKQILAYAASVIFVLLTTLPTFEGLTVNAELLMMMPVTAAALMLWYLHETKASTKISPSKFLVAGLLGGIGWLYKIPVVFDMMAIGLYFLVYNRKTLREGVRALLSWSMVAYTISFVAPLLLSFVYYYLKGTGPDYLATVLTVNLGYVSSWSTSTYVFNPLRSGLVVRGLVLFVFSVGLYLIRKKLDKRLVFTSLWVAYALFGALLSARPYPHYLQEVAPALSLMLPLIFVAESVLAWIVIGALILAGILVQKQIKFWGYPSLSVYKTYFEYATGRLGWEEYLSRFDNAERNYKLAKYLNDRLQDEDQIYIWGTDPTVYNLTKRLPSGGKYIVSFHVRDLNQYEYTMENLKASNPKYILITPGSGEFGELESYLGIYYVLAQTIDGTEIYLRLK